MSEKKFSIKEVRGASEASVGRSPLQNLRDKELVDEILRIEAETIKIRRKNEKDKAELEAIKTQQELLARRKELGLQNEAQVVNYLFSMTPEQLKVLFDGLIKLSFLYDPQMFNNPTAKRILDDAITSGAGKRGKGNQADEADQDVTGNRQEEGADSNGR